MMKEDAWTRGRKAGYEAGVENERTLVVRHLLDHSTRLDAIGLPEMAGEFRRVAKAIEAMDHVKVGREKYFAIIGACTKKVIGYCAGVDGIRETLLEEPPGTMFRRVSKKEYLKRMKA